MLETRVDDVQGEVLSLRTTRHEHAGTLVLLAGRARSLEESEERMTTHTLPDFTKALEVIEDRLSALTNRVSEQGSDQNWTLKILGAAYAVANSVGIGVLIWFVTHKQ